MKAADLGIKQGMFTQGEKQGVGDERAFGEGEAFEGWTEDGRVGTRDWM